MVESAPLRHKFAAGVRWFFLGQTTAQVLLAVTTILLARTLAVEDFAVAAIALPIIGLTQIVFGRGFATAILPKQSADVVHYHTVFTIYVGFAAVAVVLVFAGSGLAATIYGIPALKPALRILCVQLVATIFSYLPYTILLMNFKFKEANLITVTSVFLNLVSSLLLALAGFGYWALLIPGVITSTFETLSYFWRSGYRPRLQFSREIFGNYASFGAFSLGTDIMNTLANKGDYIILGKGWLPSQTGPYYFAYEKSNRPFEMVFGKVHQVILSTLSAVANDEVRFKRIFLKYLEVSLFVAFPLSVLLIGTSEKFFPILFGPKWNPAISLFQVFIVRWVVRAFGTGVPFALIALGRPKHSFGNALARVVLMLPLFLVLHLMGAGPLLVSVWVVVFDSTIYAIHYLIAFRAMNVSLREMVQPAGKALSASVVMAVSVFAWRLFPPYLEWSSWMQFLAPFTTGVVTNLLFMRRDYADLYHSFIKKTGAA